ncbi:CIA30 family protein [Mycobacterium hodleri]|uniref:CIA30 family protein n=1 Tax=Mycolicibacterium hodleri TaxID=49897 RepID=A0A544W5B7_9MYCO|nr:CIA30 family protein [Mycolicibacterium hodleri]TQR87428.1 CIA30 family protein [Mycolicibacterium hodleri]
MRSRRVQRGLTGLVVACMALLLVSCGVAGQSANADGSDVALVDLDADAVAAWTTVNDPVMGGSSTSKITFGGDGLVFSGSISLENNGGFASARSPQDPDIGRKASGAKSLRVRARGDGKTYLLKVGIAGQPWSYIQRFPTEATVDRTYDLPVNGFQPVGMRLDPEPDAPRALDPSAIDQVAVYILDKQQGPFEITVDAIEANV